MVTTVFTSFELIKSVADEESRSSERHTIRNSEFVAHFWPMCRIQSARDKLRIFNLTTIDH